MVPPRGLPFMSFPWSLRCFMIMFGCCCCCRRRRCLFVYTCFVWPLVKGGYHTYIIIFIYIFMCFPSRHISLKLSAAAYIYSVRAQTTCFSTICWHILKVDLRILGGLAYCIYIRMLLYVDIIIGVYICIYIIVIIYVIY